MTKGTLIRIFHTKDGSLLQELRRGTEMAEITSLKFEPRNKMIVCGSNTGTTHIFILKEQKEEKSKNKTLKYLIYIITMNFPESPS